MKIISRRVHGWLDYIVGLFLIILPNLLGFETGSVEARVPAILGIATIIYSVFTRYELGMLKLLPFRFHLALDLVNGLVLAASPWLFHFADRVWAPHLVVGLLELGVVMLTRTAASDSGAHASGTLV